MLPILLKPCPESKAVADFVGDNYVYSHPTSSIRLFQLKLGLRPFGQNPVSGRCPCVTENVAVFKYVASRAPISFSFDIKKKRGISKQ